AVTGASGAVALTGLGKERQSATDGPFHPTAVQEPPAQHPPERTDREMLQGRWTAMSLEMNGELRTDPAIAEFQLIFVGERVTYWNKNGPAEGTYLLDLTKSPKVLNLLLKEDTVLSCIYEVSGTGLKVSMAKDGSRPGGFDTAKESVGTMTFIFKKQ